MSLDSPLALVCWLLTVAVPPESCPSSKPCCQQQPGSNGTCAVQLGGVTARIIHQEEECPLDPATFARRESPDCERCCRVESRLDQATCSFGHANCSLADAACNLGESACCDPCRISAFGSDLSAGANTFAHTHDYLIGVGPLPLRAMHGAACPLPPCGEITPTVPDLPHRSQHMVWPTLGNERAWMTVAADAPMPVTATGPTEPQATIDDRASPEEQRAVLQALKRWRVVDESPLLARFGREESVAPRATATLRRAARTLDEMAARLEDEGLYDRADQLRAMANELRADARGPGAATEPASMEPAALAPPAGARVADEALVFPELPALPELSDELLAPPAGDGSSGGSGGDRSRLQGEIERLREQLQRVRKALRPQGDRWME